MTVFTSPVNNYRPASRSSEENKEADGADIIAFAFVKCQMSNQVRCGSCDIQSEAARLAPRHATRNHSPSLPVSNSPTGTCRATVSLGTNHTTYCLSDTAPAGSSRIDWNDSLESLGREHLASAPWDRAVIILPIRRKWEMPSTRALSAANYHGLV